MPRFLDLCKPLVAIIPDVTTPERKVPFKVGYTFYPPLLSFPTCTKTDAITHVHTRTRPWPSSVQERLLWTAVTLFIFLVCSQIPLYGAQPDANDPLYWVRAVMASSQ
jgi:protein transport protein SEC61 subunit alpha